MAIPRALTASTDPMRLDLRVIGDVAVVVDGAARRLSPQGQRVVARLVVAAGAPVSIDALGDVVDADRPVRPASVRMAVSRVRSHLGDRVRTTGSGYALVLGDDDRLDVAQLAAVLAAADAASGATRVADLRRALALWGDGPLAPYSDESWAQATTAMWAERRRLTIEDLAATLIGLGRPVEAANLLESALPDLPYRERPVALLMRALADVGRTTDALRAFARFRRELADDVGLVPSAALRQLEARLLRTDDDRPQPARAGPRPSTRPRLFGRATDVGAVAALVDEHRSVTLTGAPGVGKSSLAAHVADGSTRRFDDVHLIELAPLTDPDALERAIVDAVGATPGAGTSVLDAITSVNGRRQLLVLDNCEHLIDAVSAFVAAVLDRTSTIHVLATSREPLGLGEEQRWPVQPLDGAVDLASPAARLFVARARAVRPAFDPQDASTAVVAICNRLDGVPLAIELAAARLEAMTASEILAGLDRPVQLLAGGRRGLPHHRSLHDALSWSFELLDDRERRFLRATTVFAGGFDVGAATAVCDVGDDAEARSLIASLVRRSLIVADVSAPTTRYRLLEIVRQFAARELDGSDEQPRLAARHAHHFTSEARRRAGSPEPVVFSHGWTAHELHNLRAAYVWARSVGALEVAASVASDAAVLAWSLHRFEPIGWVEEILDRAADLPRELRARIHRAASLCMWLGDPERALDHLDAADELVDQTVPRAVVGSSRATAHLFAGRVERAAELDARLASEPGPGQTLGMCGLLYELPQLGRFADAVAIADRTVAAARATGDPFVISWALTGFGRAHAEADPERALAGLREALDLAVEHRIEISHAVIARDTARLESRHGDAERGAELYLAALDAFQQAGDSANLAVTLADLAVHLHDRGDRDIAARLAAAARTVPAARRVRELGAVDEAQRQRDPVDDDPPRRSALSLQEAADLARDRLGTAAATVSSR